MLGAYESAFAMSDGWDIGSDLDPDNTINESQAQLEPRRKICPCPYDNCKKSFHRQARLNEHLRSHTNERPFNCPERQCGKAFLRDSHLKHHIKSAHTDQRDYTCTWTNCGKKFATGTRLRRHESSHESKEKYTCKGFEGCNEIFRKHATLSRHILSVHENKKPFPCREIDSETREPCSLGFDTAEKLRSHKRAIHDQTRFICTDCRPIHGELDTQVSFATFALLRNHMAEVHPPTCPQCSLLCMSEKDMRRHLELAHKTVDPQAGNINGPSFPCTYPSCSRSFSKRGNLNVHVKTVHEHRRDFVCGETELKVPCQRPQYQDLDLVDSPEVVGCGRHFTSKATLQEHVRTIHLGIRSKRQERNRKRKAEREADVQNVDAESQDRRKRRKTCAAKSTIAKLTGSANPAVAAPFEAGPGLGNPFDAGPYTFCHLQNFHIDLDANHFPEQDYEDFLMHGEGEEESFAESGFGVNCNSLAPSAVLNPILLSG